MTSSSRRLFAAGIIGLGVLTLIYGGASLVLQAMPQGLPGREAWMYACGAVMLACGIGLFFARTLAFASAALLVYLLLWLLLLKAPIVVSGPLAIGSWESFAETATLLAGAWMIFASGTNAGRSPWLRFAVGGNGVRLARVLFGGALLVFGLAHFGYLHYTAALVPGWLPWPIAWACVTGAGYIAAGLGILFRIYPRLAAVLTTGMMSLFQLLIWVPKVAAVPADQNRWSELLLGWVLAFSAWVIADSYRGVAWWCVGKLSGVEIIPGKTTSA